MTSEEKAALVLADPAALWVVLNAGVKVAGPWARTTGRSSRALVRAGWEDENYTILHRMGVWLTIEQPDRVFQALARAEAWADARLREAGWLLVETPA